MIIAKKHPPSTRSYRTADPFPKALRLSDATPPTYPARSLANRSSVAVATAMSPFRATGPQQLLQPDRRSPSPVRLEQLLDHYPPLLENPSPPPEARFQTASNRLPPPLFPPSRYLPAHLDRHSLRSDSMPFPRAAVRSFVVSGRALAPAPSLLFGRSCKTSRCAGDLAQCPRPSAGLRRPLPRGRPASPAADGVPHTTVYLSQQRPPATCHVVRGDVVPAPTAPRDYPRLVPAPTAPRDYPPAM